MMCPELLRLSDLFKDGRDLIPDELLLPSIKIN